MSVAGDGHDAGDALDDLTGPLASALALAAIAGFVDSHLYLHVEQVFVANQSGNVVLLGMALGQRAWAEVIGPAIAIALFIAGVACATAIRARLRRSGRAPRPDLLLLAEAGLLALVAVALAQLDRSALVTDLVLGAGAFAMGVQTAVLKRVGDVAVATTYESGAVTMLGTESVLEPGEQDPVVRARRARTLRIVTAVVVAYIAGAAVAAAMAPTSAVLAIPVLALGAVSVQVRHRFGLGRAATDPRA